MLCICTYLLSKASRNYHITCILFRNVHICVTTVYWQAVNLLDNNFNNNLQQYFVELKNFFRNREVAFLTYYIFSCSNLTTWTCSTWLKLFCESWLKAVESFKTTCLGMFQTARKMLQPY